MTGNRASAASVGDSRPRIGPCQPSAHRSQNESGGKRRSGRTRHGDEWLADALVQAAWAAARSTDTYLAAKFRRVAGPARDTQRRKKAVVAVANKLLVISYAIMASPDEDYHELGGDYLARHDNPERRKTRLVAQLGKLGYDVELTPATAAQHPRRLTPPQPAWRPAVPTFPNNEPGRSFTSQHPTLRTSHG